MTRPPDPADNATHPGPDEALMAGVVLRALTRAETHALRRSQPLKPSLVNPPVDDRWSRLRPQPRHEREKQPPIWGGL
jgi:hypothetical protein